MTKTELLEQILAELKAIRAALEADDKPTGVAGKAVAEYDAMKALIKGDLISDEFVDRDMRFVTESDAERY